MTRPFTDTLEIGVGFASRPGRGRENEDFVAACPGTPSSRARLGVAAALADGIGGAKGGRMAAELSVRTFLDGYYSLPEGLGVQHAAGRVLDAVNRWIYAHARADPAFRGMGATFTAVVVAGRRAHVVHVGDSRAYHLRGGEFTRLTDDHTLGAPELGHVLHRAVGLEESLRFDYATQPVRMHDRFLLCSDGVHGALPDRRLREILLQRAGPQATARAIVAAAAEADMQDDASALVLDVVGLPAPERTDLETAVNALPVAALPGTGEVVDGYHLERVLSDSRHARLYLARDGAGGRPVVLKFPHPRLDQEMARRIAFVREAFIAGTVRSPWLGEMIEVPPGRQTRLYSVMPYYAGETLEARLKRKPGLSLREGVRIGVKLAKVVTALHRAGVIHRDIKPENVILERDGDGGLKLLDLGVARMPRIEERPPDEIPGTASYMAPELFDGGAGDELSDQYALGVTLYRAFTGGAYPYGEVEPFSHPRFGRPTRLSRLRPDLPAWLDAALARATAVEPQARFGDVMEFACALEDGLRHGGEPVATRRTPLYHRNPLRFWQIVSALLAAALIAALAV